MVLCAVARELGVVELDTQVRLLAQVLCDRDLSDADLGEHPPGEPISRTPVGIAKALWRLAGLFDAVSGELAKRPHPRKPFRYLAMLPAVGAVASYFGERRALARAVKQAREWIESQPAAVQLKEERRQPADKD